MRANRKRENWIELCVAILACINAEVMGSTVEKLDDRAMTALAGHIVRGTVTSTFSEWNAVRTQIHTIVEIKVSESLKGTLQNPESLTLKILGGKVGDRASEVVGGPVFAKDEEVILFLNSDLTKLLPVIGLFQGKLTIKVDPKSGKKTVEGRDMSPEEYLQGIRTILAEQEIVGEKVKENKK